MSRHFGFWVDGLDFNSGSPVTIGPTMTSLEGSASICSPTTGQLLFYTDGITVWDSRNRPMPSGNGVLHGNFSSTQSALIVPMPGDTTKYYVFTADQEGYYGANQGIYYSIVDMTRNSGYGDLTTVNQQLHTTASERLCAVKNSNGTDWWVICHSLGARTFWVHSVTASGISSGVAYTVGINETVPNNTNYLWTMGQLKASPNGTMLAMASHTPGDIELFKFDPCSGVVSDPIAMRGSTNNTFPYALTFSPDNRLLYANKDQDLYQYSVTTWTQTAIANSEIHITDATSSTQGGCIGGLQIAPDGKIYTVDNGDWVGVINSPNTSGQGCTWRKHVMNLANPGQWGWFEFPNNIDAWVTAGGSSANVSIAALGPTSFCQGDSVILQGPPGMTFYRWSNGDTTRSTVIRGSGTYLLSAGDGSGCAASDTMTVTVLDPPTPTIAVRGPNPFCSGDSVVLQANAGFRSYLWSTGDTTRAITVRSAGTYTVIVEDTSGCSGASSQRVDENQPPDPRIVPSGPIEFCQGGDVDLTLKESYANYQWSTGSTANRITVTKSGTYTVTVADSNGCSGATSIDIVVNTPPTPTITANGPVDFCEGGSVELAATPGFDSYLWSSGETSDRIVASTGGTYTVTVTDSNGCVGFDSIDVIVHPLPTPKITALGPTEFCQGESVDLEVEDSFASYEWSTGEKTPRITVTASGTYVVTVTNDNGCSASDSIDVKVNALPEPTIVALGPTEFCDGGSVDLTLENTYESYRWSTGETTPTITVRRSGRVSVTVADSSGCTADAWIDIDVLERSSVDIAGQDTVCPAATASYSVNGAADWTYLWSVVGGTISSGQGTGTIDVDWGSSAAALVMVQVTSTQGCTSGDTLEVLIAPPPTPEITANRTPIICLGDSITLDAGAFAAYRWSTGATTRAITVDEPGSYFVTVTNARGCEASSAPFEVQVKPDAIPEIKALDGTLICEGQSTTLDAGSGFLEYLWSTGETTRQIQVSKAGSYSVVVTDSLGCAAAGDPVFVTVQPRPAPVISGRTVVCRNSTIAYSVDAESEITYQWSVTGGQIVGGQGTGTVLVQWGAAGTGTVDVTAMVNNLTGCSGDALTLDVEIGDAIEPSIAFDGPSEFCAGDSTTLDAGTGFTSYLWTTGDTTQRITVRDAGTYTVTVQNEAGCSGVAEATVTHLPAPTPSITPEAVEICYGDTAMLEAPVGYDSYLWSTGETTRSIFVTRSGSYRVTVTDGSSCPGTSDPAIVIVHPQPKAPEITLDNGYMVSTPASTYQWCKNGLEIQGATDRRLAAQESGWYTVKITDSNGCPAVSNPYMLRWPPARLVWLDTAYARVGQRARLTMTINPPLTSLENVGGYRIRLKFPSRSLFPREAFESAAKVVTGGTQIYRISDDEVEIDRDESGPVIEGGRLFQIDFEGLSTAVPMNGVEISDIQLIPQENSSHLFQAGQYNVSVAGPGLVVLSGCDIAHGFDFGKSVAIKAVLPNPVLGRAVIRYRAPDGSRPSVSLVELSGRRIPLGSLPAGNGAEQEVLFNFGDTPAGTYMLEIRDGEESASTPVIIIN